MKLHLSTLVVLLPSSAADLTIWPPVSSASFTDSNNLPFEDEFSLTFGHVNFALSPTTLPNDRLDNILQRYNSYATAQASNDSPTTTTTVSLNIANPQTLSLNLDTDYSYSIAIPPSDSPTITANTIYGAAYGLESFLQLSKNPFTFPSTKSSLLINDAPQFPWRGLMLDVGRRFSPVPLVKNLLDSMAAAKMNVLHFHLSDYCRWSVESKTYPQLQTSLAAGLPDEGFYTHEDIAEIVAYAGDRGIRVVPEFDLPGHSFAMEILQKEGLQFCNTSKTYTIYNDPDGVSVGILKDLIAEMASLFPDDVFHLGMDEVEYPAPCTAENTVALETELVDFVLNTLHKQPMGWDPISNAYNATSSVIVNSYLSSANSKTFAEANWTVVDSSNYNWYFTHPAGWDWTDDCKPAGCAGPKGWDACWLEPGGGAAGDARDRVLGGEVSVWTDDYAYPQECGAWGETGNLANASCLYYREFDGAYASSIGGITWPRGFVAAGAFYNFDASVNVSSPEFTQRIYDFNDDVQSRGSLVCSSGKVCDYLSEGNVLYDGLTDEMVGVMGCLL